MAIIEFVNAEGKLCRFQWPPRDLSDLEEMHRGCGVSADGEPEMENLLIGPKDTLRFSHGAATGIELGQYAARKQIEVLVAQEMERHPGMTEAEADARTRLVNRDLYRQSLGVGRSLDDMLRRQGGENGYTVVDESGTKYHVSGATPKAEDQPDPDEADVVTVVERGVGRYIVHGAIAAQGYQKPADKPPSAEEARKALWRRANELSKMSPSDAMLQAILEHPELLEIIQKAREE